MTLIDRVKDALGSDEGETLYRYHCRDCGSEFETIESSTSDISCPNCGASGSRSIERL